MYCHQCGRSECMHSQMGMMGMAQQQMNSHLYDALRMQLGAQAAGMANTTTFELKPKKPSKKLLLLRR